MEGAIAHNLCGEQRTSDVAAGHIKSFGDFHLRHRLNRGLALHHFTMPTKIQAAAIPIACAGMDLLVQSKSGTGKTLIFVVAALNHLRQASHPQVMIIVPTRELAIQIEDTINGIGKYIESQPIAISCIGGTDVKNDRMRLRKVSVIIGTPGRLLHLLQNKIFNASGISMLVLDEADQLYMPGNLRETVDEIIRQLPRNRQTIATSATYENALDESLAKLMMKPLLISNSERATVLLGSRQFVYQIPEQVNSMQEMRAKLAAVRKIFEQLPYVQAMLFASSQMRADSYHNYLKASGIDCLLISGAMKQSDRLTAFEGYRQFTTRTIIATDVMARGVDSAHMNVVINLDLPKDLVTYLHRIGRAGRFGSKGISVTIVSSDKQREDFKRLIAAAGTGMSVMSFPEEKREGFDFWNFDSYNFPFFCKAEAQEQNDEELRRIRHREVVAGRPRKHSDKAVMPDAEEIQENNVPNAQPDNPKDCVENETEETKEIQSEDVLTHDEPLEDIEMSSYNTDIEFEAEQPQPLKEIDLSQPQIDITIDVQLETDNIKQTDDNVKLIANATTVAATINIDNKENFDSSNNNQSFDRDKLIITNTCEDQLQLQKQLQSELELVSPSVELIKPSNGETDLPKEDAAEGQEIDTKTYCLAVPTEGSSTTLQPLGISNTVDDASSIISDSMMENGYASDSSYESFYSRSDEKVIWQHYKTHQILQKVIKRRGPVYLYNWSTCNLKSLSKRMLKNRIIWLENEEKKFDADEQIVNNSIGKKSSRKLLYSRSKLKGKKEKLRCGVKLPLLNCEYLQEIEKFENDLEINNFLGKATKHMDPMRLAHQLDDLTKIKEQLYSKPVPHIKALEAAPIDELLPSSAMPSTPSEVQEQAHLNSPAEWYAQQCMPQIANRLSLHVNPQLNIPPDEQDAADEEEIDLDDVPLIYRHLDPEDIPLIYRRVPLINRRVDLDGVPLIDRHVDLDDVPLVDRRVDMLSDSDMDRSERSSGFVEHAESVSSGIDTSTNTNSYNDYPDDSTSFDEYNVDEGAEEEFLEISEEELEYPSTDVDINSDTSSLENDNVNANETSSSSSSDDTNGLAMNQEMWQSIFNEQLHCITSYVTSLNNNNNNSGRH